MQRVAEGLLAGNNELLQGIPRKNSTFRIWFEHTYLNEMYNKALITGSIILGGPVIIGTYLHVFYCWT